MYQTIKIGPVDRGQTLAEEFWCWEPRTQTDLLFQCPDGFIRSHKLLLRNCSKTIARAMAGLDGEEELCLVLPDVSVGVVQKFLELFYTGYTSFIDKNDLDEFQDFMYNQLKFNGHVSINDVYPDIPMTDIMDDENEKSGHNVSTLKLLSQLAPVRLSTKDPVHMVHQTGENYASGSQSQFKVKSESNDQSNLPAIDDSDIPSIVSNFLDGHSVFSPQAAGTQDGSVPVQVQVEANLLKRPHIVNLEGVLPLIKQKRKSPTKKAGSGHKGKPNEARPRYCNFCDKQFYYLEPLEIHIKNVHKDGAQPVEVEMYPGAKLTIAQQVISIKVWTEEFPQPITDPMDNTNLVCPTCRRSTKTKQSYKNHHLNNKKHGRCRGYELPTKPPKIVKDGRNFCGHVDCLDPLTGDVKVGAENWPDTMAIYRHFQEVHAKPTDLTFKCELCDKAFLTQGMLGGHKAHHLKPPCKYCGLRLTPKALKIHELNHLGEKPYSCEFCDFRSASKASVKNHKLSRHTAESERPKNHICDVENCGKAFTSKDKLKSHKRSHSDFREFLCSMCGTSVKNKEYLAKHLIIHGIKFECQHCGKVCTSQKSLDIHKRDKHGILQPVDMSATAAHHMEQQQQVHIQVQQHHPQQHHHQQVQQQQQQQQQQQHHIQVQQVQVQHIQVQQVQVQQQQQLQVQQQLQLQQQQLQQQQQQLQQQLLQQQLQEAHASSRHRKLLSTLSVADVFIKPEYGNHQQ